MLTVLCSGEISRMYCAAAGAWKADAVWSGATTPRLSSCAWRPWLCDDEPICEMRESLTIRRSGDEVDISTQITFCFGRCFSVPF